MKFRKGTTLDIEYILKAGYAQTGTADWRKGKFILMEKLLEA